MANETMPEKRATEAVATREPTRGVDTYLPAVDIFETPEELCILADMPGADSDHVDVTFENGELTLHGRVEPRQGENVRFLAREYGVGDFHRVFQVSEGIDAGSISAEYRLGVLKVHLPKSEEARPRRIQVKGE